MYSEWIYKLQTQIKTILDPLIPEGSRVALLDYPYYTNVGDSLIWLGEVEYLRSRRCEIVIVSTLILDNIDLIKKNTQSIDFILLNGGGNFGSLWPHFQAFREDIIERFTDIPIIQFPQSIFYEDKSDVAGIVELINRHGSVTLLVRDYASYELMEPFLGASVKLCPDMAFMLGPISTKEVRGKQTCVFLSRTDKEKQHKEVMSHLQSVTDMELVETDWLDEWGFEQFLIKFERRVRKIVGKSFYLNKILLYVWGAISRARKYRGIKKLNLGQVVITDRLHAHILSILLGKKHIILDNNNKKLSGFYKEWTHDLPGVILINSSENVDRELARAITKLTK